MRRGTGAGVRRKVTDLHVLRLRQLDTSWYESVNVPLTNFMAELLASALAVPFAKRQRQLQIWKLETATASWNIATWHLDMTTKWASVALFEIATTTSVSDNCNEVAFKYLTPDPQYADCSCQCQLAFAWAMGLRSKRTKCMRNWNRCQNEQFSHRSVAGGAAAWGEGGGKRQLANSIQLGVGWSWSWRWTCKAPAFDSTTQLSGIYLLDWSAAGLQLDTQRSFTKLNLSFFWLHLKGV